MVQILHPRSENPACNKRKLNPLLEAIVGGAAAGAAVILVQKLYEKYVERRAATNPHTAEEREQIARAVAKVIHETGFHTVADEFLKEPEKRAKIIEFISSYLADPKFGYKRPDLGEKFRALASHALSNPPLSGAAQAYEDFHGRPPKEVLELQEACCAAGDYYTLGDLRGLWLTRRKGDITKWGEADIRFADADGVKLAASPDSTQLYLIGGNQRLAADDLKQLGADLSKEFIPLGCVYAVSYATEKNFDGFRRSQYVHEFGEETGVVPAAFYCKTPGRIILVGGAYSIAPPDQQIGASPGIVN
ncbi:MAG: hypothetical protein L0212_04130 [Acidobacteria bacterium]|nr:hypothetical protein [Acidobacteriota bacterium]